jgi:membrane protease YdiL (CAAX protease family)
MVSWHKISLLSGKVLWGGLIMIEFVVFGFLSKIGSTVHPLFMDLAWLSFIAAVFFTVWVLHRKLNQLSLKKAGFVFSSFWKNLFLGSFLALVIFTICLIISWLLLDVQLQVVNHVHFKYLFTSILTCCIIGAWEETLFRGYILVTLLKNKLNPIAAILISSLLFGLIHFSSIDPVLDSVYWPLGAFAIGCILSILFLHTGSIIAPIAFHAVWDVFANMIDKGNTGIFIVSNISVISKQFENSIVAVLLFLTPVVWYLLKSRKFWIEPQPLPPPVEQSPDTFVL